MSSAAPLFIAARTVLQAEKKEEEHNKSDSGKSDSGCACTLM